MKPYSIIRYLDARDTLEGAKFEVDKEFGDQFMEAYYLAAESAKKNNPYACYNPYSGFYLAQDNIVLMGTEYSDGEDTSNFEISYEDFFDKWDEWSYEKKAIIRDLERKRKVQESGKKANILKAKMDRLKELKEELGEV